ncbi:hypothetical protein [Mycolicibacterium sphagni]|uniref:Head-to-tail stopper n=1 Tax=Mycolicibacterium sphagni TaxID=1786 RepID=A0A255DXF6_9MYCO|nr:hypothetical protein [Mycolicibacterium sphagni]OYN80423.1 hypothetical protein CG716_09860 [Mycolicibacterium sphagni]
MTTAGFPANLPVQWETRSPGPRDEMNEETDVWADPVERKVISYSSRQTVLRDDGHVALDTDQIRMQIPIEGFEWTARDRVTVPGRGQYLVVGIDDGVGFHGWRPGLTLVLKSVTAVV